MSWKFIRNQDGIVMRQIIPMHVQGLNAEKGKAIGPEMIKNICHEWRALRRGLPAKDR